MSSFSWILSKQSPPTTSNMSFSLGAINRDTVVTAVIIFASIAFSSFYIYVDIEKIKESAEQEKKTVQEEKDLLKEENLRLSKRLLLYEGAKQAIDSLTLDDCEHYETVLKSTLHQIEQRKCNLLKNQIESEKGNRLCVVCQEKEKSVVLLPCRHLCLCYGCSESHQSIARCPLCRQSVNEKITVFA
mmetsp:Transcript_16245/g.17597  ORF Transcript_16245/g.17597 Transcript_16245/m.17597 type:complete len:187 (+) Transcript_16245:158-718(+)